MAKNNNEPTRRSCPECESDRGFDNQNKCLNCGTHNIVQVVNESMGISESVGTTLEETIRLRDRGSETLTLQLMFVSMAVAALIPAIEFWHPISILASVFIGFAPLGVTTYYVKKTITIQYGKK